MPRTQIPVFTVNRESYFPNTPVNGDIVNGMYFDLNTGVTWLEIDNPGVSAVQVGAVIQPTTYVKQNTVDGVSVPTVAPDKTITVGPGSTAYHFGPFPTATYNQGQQVYIDVDPLAIAGTAGTALQIRAFNVGS